MKLYKKGSTVLIEHEGEWFSKANVEWDSYVNKKNLFSFLLQEITTTKNADAPGLFEAFDAPIDNQEIWAAGVTYFRSKEARMEESKDTGGGSFYDKVYSAERPELFFKALAHRTSGHMGAIHIRKDSNWNVPEPELTLFICSAGSIEGYTVGDDMSSRSIEGENPLYLPQAKSYDKSAALGPCLYVPGYPIAPESLIQLQIKRSEQVIFTGSIAINQMKRKHQELVEFLFRECDFPFGCFLMTGTGIVPPDHFTLQVDDEVSITIDSIGTLTNIVKTKS